MLNATKPWRPPTGQGSKSAASLALAAPLAEAQKSGVGEFNQPRQFAVSSALRVGD